MPIKMESVVTNLPEIKSEIKAEDFCVTADTSSIAVSTSSSTSTGNVTPTHPNHHQQQNHLDSTTQVQQHHQQPSQTQLHPNSCNWVGK